jgi:CPA1 family monovalent cation:H+ antiporter
LEPIELVLGLLLAVAVLATVARRLRIAYPIALVLGGLALGLIPALPQVELPPDVVFVIFLPPLVYEAALFSPLRDFRRNMRPIALLAIGLVLVSMAAVASAARFGIDDFNWGAALVLAAIVAPPDAVAITAIADYLRVPRRVITILEGEGMLNDVTALVAYRLAVAAAVTGTFSLTDAAVWLVLGSVGGVAIGLAAGWLSVWVRVQLEDSPVEITVSLLTPFAAYLPAEALGASGILAAVAAGLYVGRKGIARFTPETRVRARAVWQMVTFLLNGLGFILIGLQLDAIVDQLGEFSYGTLLGYAAVVCGTLIGVRFAWVFGVPLVMRLLPADAQPYPSWKSLLVVGWAGMRGVDSLATALALPLLTAAGTAFPQRNLILFLSFSVVLATLVGQGLTLPPLIRWLGIPNDREAEREEMTAHLAIAEAALKRLEELSGEPWVDPEAAAQLRTHYERQARHFQARLSPQPDGKHRRRAANYYRLRLELLDAARRAALDLRERDVINDEVLRHVERDIDLEELRLEE